MFKPMLAPNKSLKEEDVKSYPVLASVKLDGIRLLITPEAPYLHTRSGKHIQNQNVFERLAKVIEYVRTRGIVLDGEWWSPDRTFQELISSIMKREAKIPQDIQFHCFDMLTPSEVCNGYRYRYLDLCDLPTLRGLAIVPHVFHYEWSTLASQLLAVVSAEGEGLMVRTLEGTYKHGRATYKENIIYKLKPFETAEAIIVGVEQMMVLNADAEERVDAFGNLTRSSSAADRHPTEAMGALVVTWEDENEFRRELRIGSGFTDAQRVYMWKEQSSLIGKVIEFKYMTAGMKDLPRCPVFLRFRDDK